MYLAKVDLADFLGQWVAVTERVRFDYGGSYSVCIVRITDGHELLRIDDRSLDLWRMSTTGLRPKWGIYRSIGDNGSLKGELRDEIVRFADFEIENRRRSFGCYGLLTSVSRKCSSLEERENSESVFKCWRSMPAAPSSLCSRMKRNISRCSKKTS